jgi:hypothetical protein
VNAYFKGVWGAISDFPKMWLKRKQWLKQHSASGKMSESEIAKIEKSEKEVMEMILRRSRKRKGRAVKPVEFYLKLFF